MPYAPLSDDTNNPFKGLERAIDNLTVPLENFFAKLSLLQAPIGSITAGMGRMISVGLTPLTAAMEVYTAAATGQINIIQSLVAKANPAAAFQFNRALDDLAATMGQILTPILQGVTVFVRAVADGLQGLKPALEPLMKGIGETIAALAPLAQALMQLTGPAFQLVSEIIQNIVVPAVKTLAEALTDFVNFCMKAANKLTFGLADFEEFKAKSSVGAAIRPAAYGKIEERGKRTTLAALNAHSAEDKHLAEQKKTNEILQKMLEKVGIDPKKAGNVVERVRDAFHRGDLANEIRRLMTE